MALEGYLRNHICRIRMRCSYRNTRWTQSAYKRDRTLSTCQPLPGRPCPRLRSNPKGLRRTASRLRLIAETGQNGFNQISDCFVIIHDQNAFLTGLYFGDGGSFTCWALGGRRQDDREGRPLTGPRFHEDAAIVF